MSPDQLKYTKTHEWVALEGDTATIGITDFAAQLLSDLVFASLPEVETVLVQGKPFGEVESVKAVSDLYAPISGVVVARNERLMEHRGNQGEIIPADLDVLTTSPFTDGWMLKVRVSNPQEISALMEQSQYKAHCETSDH